jgi:putative nucleotidyltransferase-like protein
MPAAAAVDWERFLQLVRRHRVGPVVHRSGWLERAGAPSAIVERLASDAQGATVAALRALSVQREALATLEAASIPVLVLKGAPLAQEWYGALSARYPGDLDLLVAPERTTEAVAALERSGFEWQRMALPPRLNAPDGGRSALDRVASLPLIRDALLLRSDVYVELHWRLMNNSRLIPVAPEWLRSPHLAEVGGIACPVLPPVAQWWHVMVHGTDHTWRWLKWLADVPAAVAVHPALVSAPVLEQTRHAGFERCVACGLRVAELTFGPFLPAPAAAWAGSVPGVDRLVRRSLDALARETGDPEYVTPRTLPDHVLARMALRSDWPYRRAEARGLMLEAARAQLDPGVTLGSLAVEPLRWLARESRRQRRARVRSR